MKSSAQKCINGFEVSISILYRQTVFHVMCLRYIKLRYNFINPKGDFCARECYRIHSAIGK